MRARTTLKLIVCASAAVAALLGHLSYLHAQALSGLPGSAWGSPQLSSALLTVLSALGAVAAAWYGLSALLALVATAPQPPRPRRRLPASLGSQVAGYLLQRWGAPAIRRLAAGTLALSLSASPALAAEVPPPHDLGWQPSTTATVPSQADGAASTPTAPDAPSAAAEPTHSETRAAPSATPGTASAPASGAPTPAPGPAASPGARPGTSPSTAPQAPGAAARAPAAAPIPPEAPTPAQAATGGPSNPAGAGRGNGGWDQRPPAQHTVRPGESLWSISAAHLGLDNSAPELVTAWPQLYQRNRETLGPDPSLIQPGTVLQLPWEQP